MNFKSITVAELKELLEGQEDDALVTFASDYGDHCHTQQVHRLRGEIDEVVIRETAYSDSRYAVNERADEDDEDDETRHAGTVLLIS
jgi:hypothetical protein